MLLGMKTVLLVLLSVEYTPSASKQAWQATRVLSSAAVALHFELSHNVLLHQTLNLRRPQRTFTRP
jgi:hypothetical protein